MTIGGKDRGSPVHLEREPFQTWITVRLGGFKDPDELLSEVEETGVDVPPWALDIALELTLSGAQDCELVVLTLSAIGLDTSTPIDEVIARAREYGLSPVPQDAALFVALQGVRAEPGQYVFATESIFNSKGHRITFFFTRERDGYSKLDVIIRRKSLKLHLDTCIVLARA
ncbi:MAG: hypothetical protein WD049_02095 [Candidatus Paceibacterota bacterium]